MGSRGKSARSDIRGVQPRKFSLTIRCSPKNFQIILPDRIRSRRNKDRAYACVQRKNDLSREYLRARCDGHDVPMRMRTLTRSISSPGSGVCSMPPSRRQQTQVKRAFLSSPNISSSVNEKPSIAPYQECVSSFSSKAKFVVGSSPMLAFLVPACNLPPPGTSAVSRRIYIEKRERAIDEQYTPVCSAVYIHGIGRCTEGC